MILNVYSTFERSHNLAKFVFYFAKTSFPLYVAYTLMVLVANSPAASKVFLTSIVDLVSWSGTYPPPCKRGELFREVFLLFQLGFTLNSPGFW